MTDSLAVSPDLEAYYCYAVVLLAGVIVAYAKLRRFFEGKPGAWGVFSSWGLFATYALIPVALFWFLDRTAAIHDTSLFAALLIGFGYQQVLTGSSSVRGPADLNRWWQPFQSWANWTSDRILDRVKLRSDRFAETVIRELRNDPTLQKLQKLKNLAYTHVADPKALQAQYDAIDTPANQALFGPDGVREKQVTLLYQTIRDVRDGHFLLFRAGVISRFEYYWQVKEVGTIARASLFGLPLLIAMIGIVPQLFQSQYVSRYYLWRIAKSNSSVLDQGRAKTHLINCLTDKSANNWRLVTQALQHDELSVDTADRLIAVVVETRSRLPQSDLRSRLTESLRTENPDVRTRVHSALIYLARDAGLCVEPSSALNTWKPSKSDSSMYIDQQVKNWTQQWSEAKRCP